MDLPARGISSCSDALTHVRDSDQQQRDLNKQGHHKGIAQEHGRCQGLRWGRSDRISKRFMSTSRAKTGENDDSSMLVEPDIGHLSSAASLREIIDHLALLCLDDLVKKLCDALRCMRGLLDIRLMPLQHRITQRVLAARCLHSA